MVASEVAEADLPNPMLHLPEGLSLMEKWLWLTKDPDFVAADIAVNGFQIYWKDPNVTPPLMYVGDAIHSPSIPRTSRNQEERLSLIVDEWEERAIVTKDLQKIPTHAHFSRLFGVVKDKTEIRPVIDLSLLNQYLKCPDLKMETLEKLLDLVQDPMWAAIIDVQDAFLSVKIAVQFQKFFCFILKKKAYMFLRMPFGLSPAPWIFSRLMKTIKKFLRIRMVNINSFIDDFIIWARSYPLAVIHMNWTKQLLTWLGLTVNVKKSSVAPQQLIQYLGVILDLRHLTLQLPQAKVEKLLSLTKSVSSHTLVSRRTLESLVGLIMFSHSILPLGRMHANPLIMWLNKHTSATARDALVGIDASLLQLLSPFLNRKWLQSKASFKKLTPDLVLMSDASDFGWSGVVMPYCIRDSWWQQEQQESINWREMAAILYSVTFLKTKIQGRSLMIHTDNLVTFFCLKKMGSIRCPLMNSLVRDFLSVLEGKNHFSGPTHKGQQQCTCGRRIKGQSGCCPQLSGPSHFRVLFQKVRICTLDGLVRIHGEYEVQVLHLSMSGQQSKLPGSRCPVSGLEQVRQGVHVSPSSASPKINFKDHVLPGKRCPYSSLYEQFFPGSSGVQSVKKDKVTRDLFSFPNEEWFHGDPSEVLGLVDVGIRPIGLVSDVPKSANLHTPSGSNLASDQVPEEFECVDSAFSSEQSRRLPQAPLPDIPPVVRGHRSALIYNRYLSRGLTKQAAKTCLNKHSTKTKNQYGGKWRRFIQFLEKKQIPDAEVKEETVVNFLSYRQLEQRVKPLTLVNDYYGIVEPLLAAFNVKINLLASDSLVKHFLDGSLRDSKRKPMFDKFPCWKLQTLLDYLNSNMFEPLEEADFDCLLRKTVILTLVNTGRRACEISALTPDFSESKGEIQLNWYNNFVAKSERPFDNWLSSPPKLSKIDPCGSNGEKQERFENLCPTRAFKLYIAKRKLKETPEFKNYLWLASPPDLSSIIKSVLLDMLRWRYPGIPPAELPSVGTHQIRKLVISTEWMYRPMVLHLPRWVGNRGMSVLNTIYIRDTQAPSCHAALPGGTLYENMVQIRFPITPRRS